jgi:alpha-L-fucosidase
MSWLWSFDWEEGKINSFRNTRLSLKEKRKNMNKAILYVTLLGSLLSAVSAQDVKVKQTGSAPSFNETPEHRDTRMAWFREARFGMFIHWGIYAVPAGVYKGKDVGGIGEWIMNSAQIPVAEYKAFAPQFTAAQYDPEAWAALAKRAGMRYVVITSKHHDGCTLFDSAASDWSMVKAAGAKRDLIAPLEKAVRGQGLRFGLYYSQAQDWINPGGGCFKNKKKWDPAQEGNYDQYLTKVAVPQVEELLSKFHPDLVWWDTPVDMTPARAAFFAPVLAKYPDLVMNNRLGGGVPGDCETPEQNIPPRGFPGRDFEVCMTMNDTWGYKSKDNHWKPASQILQHLSDISSKGGNFLLNVGPTAEGLIPQASIERLEAVGKWMDVNAVAIHGTQASPFAKRLPWGRVTRKADASGGGETLYLHVWDWPKDGKLEVPHAGQDGAAATLLATKAAVPAAVNGGNLILSLPSAAPDADISVIALHLPKVVVDTEATLESPDDKGVVHLSVHDADSIGNYSGNMPVSGSGAEAYLGPWTDSGWKLEYRLKAPKAMAWLVQAEIAAAAPVSLRLQTGKTTLSAAIPATGGAAAWKTIDLGIITLGAGEPSFLLHADAKKWNAIGLRNITLSPHYP